MSKVIHINDDSFQAEALESDLPVLVDFWAEWCAPCKQVAPILDEISEEYDGKIKIAKLDTESSQQIPARYGIRGIPTMILFDKGKVVDQIVGAVPKNVIIDFLNKVRQD